MMRPERDVSGQNCGSLEMWIEMIDSASVYLDASSPGLFKSSNERQQSGFSGTAWPNQSEAFTLPKR